MEMNLCVCVFLCSKCFKEVMLRVQGGTQALAHAQYILYRLRDPSSAEQVQGV